MAFEVAQHYGRKRIKIPSELSSEMKLFLSVSDCSNSLKNKTTERVIRFTLGSDLMDKLKLYDRRVLFLIDDETNQGMLKASKDGYAVSVNNIKNKDCNLRGYLRMKIPTKLNWLENKFGVELKIIRFTEDSVIFNLPEQSTDSFEQVKEDVIIERTPLDELNDIISDLSLNIVIVKLENDKFKVINRLESHNGGDIYDKEFNFHELSIFVDGWSESFIYELPYYLRTNK